MKQRTYLSMSSFLAAAFTLAATAPHCDRKPLVTLRKMVDGRMSRSEPLLVGGTPGSVMKVKRLSRSFP